MTRGRKPRYPYDIEIGESFELQPGDPEYVASRMNQTMRRRNNPRRYAQRGRVVHRIGDEIGVSITLPVKRRKKNYRTLAVGEYVDYESALLDHTKHGQIRRYACVSGKEFRVTGLTPNRGIRVLRIA